MDHERKFGSDERELLLGATAKYSPKLLHLVGVVGSRPQTDKEREELRAGLAREFTSVGLEEDSEPNEYEASKSTI